MAFAPISKKAKTMIPTASPLQWPDNMPRTPSSKRVRSPFRTNHAVAVQNVIKSLQGFQKDAGIRIENPVLSSQVDFLGRLNGSDPGAAAWFKMEGQWVAFGVDRFPDVAGNIQAIHHIIEARRVELRYGGLAIVRQTFKSFIALPAPALKRWFEVLGVSENATPDQINAAYRRLAAEHHPDKGGSHNMMAELNTARDAGLKEIS
jgi:hypothetical protein